jgi:hypothetical protein
LSAWRPAVTELVRSPGLACRRQGHISRPFLDDAREVIGNELYELAWESTVATAAKHCCMLAAMRAAAVRAWLPVIAN